MRPHFFDTEAEYREAVDALLKAWLEGRALAFHKGYQSELSTDGTSVFSCGECVATRAPTATGELLVLLNGKQYHSTGRNGLLRAATSTVLEREGISTLRVKPAYRSWNTEPEALIETWYEETGLRLGDDGGAIARRTRYVREALKPRPEERSEAKVLPFRPRA